MALDRFDRRILALLQQDAALPIAALADKVGLSPSPCWRRVQKLEAEGYIRARVALLDARKMNLGVTVFVAIRTNQHNAKWLEAFSKAVVGIPEILDVYRRLIGAIELYDVSSTFAMEVLKSTTVLPVDYA